MSQCLEHEIYAMSAGGWGSVQCDGQTVVLDFQTGSLASLQLDHPFGPTGYPVAREI